MVVSPGPPSAPTDRSPIFACCSCYALNCFPKNADVKAPTPVWLNVETAPKRRLRLNEAVRVDCNPTELGPLQEKEEIHLLSLSLPCGDRLGWWPSTSQVRPHQEPNQPAPWSWISQSPELREHKLLFKQPSLWYLVMAALANHTGPSSQDQHQRIKSFPSPMIKTCSQNSLASGPQKSLIFTDETTLHHILRPFHADSFKHAYLWGLGAKTIFFTNKWHGKSIVGGAPDRLLANIVSSPTCENTRTLKVSLWELVSSAVRGGKWDG